LDGSVFDLASLKGRIVVLDFWASRSAGSAERLSAHAWLARRYAARGVLFLAINVEQTERTIREFLARNPLDLPIALDRSASIARLYRVQSLPQTMVIASDGRIQAAYGPVPVDTSIMLRDELDRLLAGSNPATQPGPQPDR
jgi:peroxiredoxin